MLSVLSHQSDSEHIDRDRIKRDLGRQVSPKFDDYWKLRRGAELPTHLFPAFDEIWFDLGAGSGDFFLKSAPTQPNTLFLAIERDRMRAKSLLKRTEKLGRDNFHGFRGNCVPTFVNGLPTSSLDRIYILYPCPWPKNGQRKNRWYMHPVMQHLYRALKPNGLLIWASDQKFYIDEAQFACESHYKMECLVHGEIAPNEYNGLSQFPNGRTKFERTFLEENHPCFELIVRK